MSTSIEAQTSSGFIPTGMTREVPPRDSLGAVLEEIWWTGVYKVFLRLLMLVLTVLIEWIFERELPLILYSACAGTLLRDWASAFLCLTLSVVSLVVVHYA